MTSIRDKVDRSSALDAAMRLVEVSDVRPGEIKRRLLSIIVVLVMGTAGVLGALVVIWAGLARSENARALVGFGLVAALAVVLTSLVGAVFMLWSAYVVQYVRSVGAQEEGVESTEQARSLLATLNELRESETFRSEFATVLMACFAEAGAQVSANRQVVNRVVGQRKVQLRLEEVIDAQLRKREDVAALLDDHRRPDREVDVAATIGAG
jgi:hypothetical protein